MTAVHHPAGVGVREPGGELGAHLGDGDRRPARAVGRRVERTAVDALEHQGALGALGETVDVEHLDEVAVVQAREAADLLGAHDEVLAVHRGQRHHRDLAAQHRVEPPRGGVDRAGTGVPGGGGRLFRIRRPHPLRRCTLVRASSSGRVSLCAHGSARGDAASTGRSFRAARPKGRGQRPPTTSGPESGCSPGPRCEGGGGAGNRTRVLRSAIRTSPCAVRGVSTRIHRSCERAGVTIPAAV